MLGKNMVYATIAVSDLEKAKEFYGGTLELEVVAEMTAGVMYQSGEGQLFVYPSMTAGTNKATYAGWNVEDVAELVEELRGKGVTFEHYEDMPGVQLDGDVHVMGEYKAAWFTDPDGNILALNSVR